MSQNNMTQFKWFNFNNLKFYIVNGPFKIFLKCLFDSGCPVYDTIIHTDYKKFINEKTFFLLSDKNNEEITWDQRCYNYSTRMPTGYDVVLGLKALSFFYANKFLIIPFNIYPVKEKEIKYIPYVSNNENNMCICFESEHSGHSLIFDTGAFGSFDMIISQKIANTINSLQIMEKTKNIDRIDTVIPVKVGKMNTIYFKHNSKEYLLKDITIFIEEENTDCGGIYYDCQISCNLMKKLYLEHDFIICAC